MPAQSFEKALVRGRGGQSQSFVRCSDAPTHVAHTVWWRHLEMFDDIRPMHKPKKSQEVPFEEDGGSGVFRVQGFRVFFLFSCNS